MKPTPSPVSPIMGRVAARPRRVAILGGGISGLTAAWELTRTPALRARHEVTVYQLGWRLGGKLSSGRSGHEQRNLEHGLHVWFGFYDNAFNLLRDVCAEWRPHPFNPHRRVEDILKPRRFTPVGDAGLGGQGYFPLLWPANGDRPGRDDPRAGGWGFVSQWINTIAGAVLHPPRRLLADEPHLGLLDHAWARAWRASREPPVCDQTFAAGPPWQRAAPSWLVGLLDAVFRLGGSVGDQGIGPFPGLGNRVAEGLFDATGELRPHGRLLLYALRRLADAFRAQLASLASDHPYARYQCLFGEYLTTLTIGLLNPAYGVARDWDIDRLNHLEYTDFLAENGASEALRTSWFTTVLYESSFEYRDGDRAKPDMEAGTALRLILRLITSYRGAPIYEVSGGMGDLVIGPLYEVLRARGVRFELFHKVAHLALSPDRRSVARIDFDVQARTLRGPYEPLITIDRAPCWPAEPRWEQLEGGDALKARGVNFESKWECGEPVARRSIRCPDDFDAAVLALPLGAFKPLGNGDPSPCDELIAHNPAFRDAVEHLGLVPSQAVQIWMTRDGDGLGFDPKREGVVGLPAVSCGPAPLSVWADMTQVLDVENWPGPDRPRSVHYLCGVLHSAAYRAPRAAADTQRLCNERVRRDAVEWLERNAATFWPNAADAERRFDWATLFDAAGRTGERRFDAQFWRANIDPADCCVASHRDTARYRLRADESGFDNLALASTWIRNGLNACCVESAVMSGMAAAQAVSGDATRVLGARYLHPWAPR